MMRYYWKRHRWSLFLIPFVLLANLLLLTWGVLQDSLVRVLLLVVGLYGGFILWRWMTGAIWRPAIILLIQIPFQGILGIYLGTVANFISWIPVVAFLIQIPRSDHIRSLFGSWTQRLLGVFLFALSFAVVIAIPASNFSDVLKDFGQKITLFFFVAVLARAFQQPGFDRKALLAISVSMAIMVSLALMEHYLRISVIRSAPIEFIHVWDYRLGGPGNSMPINRMAFYHILPISLVVGSLLTSKTRVNLLSLLTLSILGLGLVSTGSRGGMLGTLCALGLIWWHSRAKVISGIIIAIVILAGAVIATTIVPPEAFTRSEGTGALANADVRVQIWERTAEYFVENPILGLGWGQLAPTVLQDDPLSDEETAATAHNSLLKMLSESGLVGTIPFIVLGWHIFKVLWRGAHLGEGLSGPLNVGAFAAFSGMLLATMTSVYQFERYFWVPAAFAASLELGGIFQPASRAQDDGLLPRRTVPGSH